MSKNIVLTGVSSGIGNAVAKTLLETNYDCNLIAIGRSNDNTLSKHSNYHFYKVDFGNLKQVRLVIEKILIEYNVIDVLINNAGSATKAVFEDMPIEVAKSEFDINFWSPALLMKKVVVGMKEQNNGTIINISSLGSFFATPTLGYYAISKCALNSLILLLKNEVTDSNVKLCTVYPGAVKTKFGRNINDMRQSEKYKNVYESWNRRFRYFFRKAISAEQTALAIVKLIDKPQDKLFLTKRDWFIYMLSKVLPERVYMNILFTYFYKDEG